MKDTKYDFDDILIKPNVITDIESRFSDINPYYRKDYLPLMTAPMSSVVNIENHTEFLANSIKVVFPRTIDYWDRKNMAVKATTSRLEELKTFHVLNSNDISWGEDNVWASFSLKDFKKYYIENFKEDIRYQLPNHVLIDIANGHIKDILDSVIVAKEINPDMVVMVGNIANPETYRWYAESGVVDYVRVGIGNGNGCLTTQQTGVGYPKASLIAECRAEKEKLDVAPYIVADGGMKDYSDIIKALALGADYVMVGSIFNKALESAGKNYLYGVEVNNRLAKKFYGWGLPVKKQFYGMSTKLAQKEMGLTKFKTSEGVVKYRKIEYRLDSWVNNFEHYLRSAMSYCNAKTLDEFIGQPDIIRISENSFKRFNK